MYLIFTINTGDFDDRSIQVQGLQFPLSNVNYAQYFMEEITNFLKFLLHTVCDIPKRVADDYLTSTPTHVSHIIKEYASSLAQLSAQRLSEDQVYIYAKALHTFGKPASIKYYHDLHMSRSHAEVLHQYSIEIVSKLVEVFDGAAHYEVLNIYA